MLRWLRLTKDHYLGLFALGLVVLALQEIPYVIDATGLIPLGSNPLMEMTDQLWWLSAAEKIIGLGCVVVMLFLVRADDVWFSAATRRERFCLAVAVAALVAYYAGWIAYFSGHQSPGIMIGLLIAMQPISFCAIGLWRRNLVLSVLAVVFLVTHVANAAVDLWA
ncbi:MAG: hypothetical protein LBJ44_03910 [Propionibacteriaceae bacterium]|jgi:hypothetical protein|nr:hypothetical protein [Propionibacteriaceae bacterium]